MTFQTPYGWFDRALHQLAFANPNAQRTLGELEARLFRGRLQPALSKRPVFVTSLPRAGTTLLLNVLHALPEFASATYRHMPFALSPLLWQSLSGRFRRDTKPRERAHGDGMQVGFDSPEAFEEIVWTAFWRTHFGTDRIAPWAASERDPKFEAFFSQYMRRVVAAAGAPARRYLSKNNANIARLGLLPTLFPDCTIVAPIRNPWAQAASLERQHRRFCQIHAEMPFSRRYMTWLGHFEFGAILKPIDFAGWLGRTPASPNSLEFWLSYWVAAVDAILSARSDRLVLVDYDAMCRDPSAHLAALGHALDIADPDLLLAQAPSFRPPRPVEAPVVDEGLIERVLATHRAARLRSLCPLHKPAPRGGSIRRTTAQP